MDANTPVILIEQLKACGLSVIEGGGTLVSAMNPLNLDLKEVLDVRNGLYVTDWEYELGEVGDEVGTAQRLAFLLGIPSRVHKRCDLISQG